MSATDAFVPRVEEDRLPNRAVRITAALGVATIVVSLVIAKWLMGPTMHGGAAAPVAPVEMVKIEQTQIRDTHRGLALRAAQRDALGKYGWVDRDAGVARIPIDRAIDLVVQAHAARAAVDAHDATGGKGAR